MIFIRYINSFPYIQYFIDRTLKLHRKYYCIFIDNIIIFSDIFKNYNNYLKIIFSLFEKKNININPEKIIYRLSFYRTFKFLYQYIRYIFYWRSYIKFLLIEISNNFKSSKNLFKNHRFPTFVDILLYINRRSSLIMKDNYIYKQSLIKMNNQ